MANLLKTIDLRAKKIQKKHPGKKYQTAKKEAWKEYRQRKIGKVRKKTAKKKSTPKAGRPITGIQFADGTTLAQAESATRKKLEQKLGWLLVNKEMATSVAARRKYSKEIFLVKKKLKALS